MKILIEIKSCNDCQHGSHTGAFTKGGSKPWCDHPEAIKKKGHLGLIPYKNIPDPEGIHKYIRVPKSIPKWCPLRKFQYKPDEITKELI